MKEDIRRNSGLNHYKAVADKVLVSICAGSNTENQLHFTLPANYQPDESEVYMNSMQLEYFGVKLYEWKQSLTVEILNGEKTLSDQNSVYSDSMDIASAERDKLTILLSHERRLYLLKQIDLALQRIQQGDFGYCLETEDEIGIKRLLLNPVALYTVEVQTKLELHALQNLSFES